MSDPENGTPAVATAEPPRALLFTLAEREFALSVESIVEVVRHKGATPVPRSAAAVEGIVPIRGRMVTVVDLRACLALPPRPDGASPRLIVVETAEERVGLVVDRLRGVSPPGPGVSLLDVGALLRGFP